MCLRGIIASGCCYRNAYKPPALLACGSKKTRLIVEGCLRLPVHFGNVLRQRTGALLAQLAEQVTLNH